VIGEAIRYGMTLKEFWYADPRLLISYKYKYIRDTSYKAWLDGSNSFAAFGLAMANAFAKKGTPSRKFPDWSDPVEKIRKLHKKEKYEIVQHRQEMWFYNMLQS
jgi:hypothetical protein